MGNRLRVKPCFQAPEAFCFLHALPVCKIRVQLRLPRWPPTLLNILIKLPEYKLALHQTSLNWVCSLTLNTHVPEGYSTRQCVCYHSSSSIAHFYTQTKVQTVLLWHSLDFYCVDFLVQKLWCHLLTTTASGAIAVTVCLFSIFFIHLFSSGNCTPGSRSYSDLVDTWADSVCIHQLVLRPCPKSASMQYNCRWLTYGLFQLTHTSRDDHAVQLMKFEQAMAAKTKTKHYYSAHNLATTVNFGT